jgi:hypothetical protein
VVSSLIGIPRIDRENGLPRRLPSHLCANYIGQSLYSYLLYVPISQTIHLDLDNIAFVIKPV